MVRIILLFISVLLTNVLMNYFGCYFDRQSKIDILSVLNFIFSYKIVICAVSFSIAYFIVFKVKNLLDELLISIFSSFKKFFRKEKLLRAFVSNKWVIEKEGTYVFASFEGRERIKFFFQNLNPIYKDSVIFTTINAYFSIFMAYYFFFQYYSLKYCFNDLIYYLTIALYVIAYVFWVAQIYVLILVQENINSVYKELMSNE